MSKEQDQAFFRNFSLIVGALAVMMIVFIILARIIGIDDQVASGGDDAVFEQTAPVGSVYIKGEVEEVEVVEVVGDMTEETVMETTTEVAAASGDAGAIDGKKIYDGVCFACHGSGVPNVPQLGDATAWAPRIAQGNETLYTNAINGFTGSSGMPMPPRGMNPDLSDDEVKAAVDYMVSSSQ